MNKKTMLIISVMLLITALLAFMAKNMNSGTLDEQQNTCASASSEYKSQYKEADAWLDQKLVEWKPATTAL